MFLLLIVCLVVIAYVYAGYPLVMAVVSHWSLVIGHWGLGSAARLKAELQTGSGELVTVNPASVSVVIAVFNDAVVLREKLGLLLASEGALIGEVLVGSDGSTDDVAGVLAELGDDRVRVLSFEERRGKTAVLNDVVPQCANEIVVMMDARQRVAAGAVEALVRRFEDDEVGVVSGELVFEDSGFGIQDSETQKTQVCHSASLHCRPPRVGPSPLRSDSGFQSQVSPSAAAEGMGAYWRYEKWIRKNEARVASVPGATGACYAIRKALFRRIPDETILDDVAFPMMAVLAGSRCVFDENAVVFDRPSDESKQEMVRKRRTLAGNVQLVRLFPRFLCPKCNPIWFQFVSHKILRLFVPFLAILAVFAAGWCLFMKNGFPAIFSAVLLFFVTFSAVFCVFGAFFEKKGRKNRVFSLFWMFFVLNWVTFLGVIDGVMGKYRVTWEKAYEEGEENLKPEA